MRKVRYFLEDVPEGHPTEAAKHLKGEWHAVWIDPNTLFGIADVHDYELVQFGKRPTVTVLASAVDNTPAKQQAGKKADALAAHGVQPNDTVHQAAYKIARKFKHNQLEP
jgi:hypothetical protein